MGAKDSKPSFITYEDAVKRVSDSELRRIREAFKRCAGASGATLSLEAFVHEVLCDGVPCEVAEWLYQACGGTKRGIALRDLLCGIVVLTKGTIEEKIKFLWILYTNNQTENGAYIYKRDFTRTLHMENSSLPPNYNQRSTEILLGLFGMGDRVTYDQFRSWLLIHKDATVLSKWLMSDVNSIQDLETPTFYQSLAGVTHLEERDIIELEKCFWSLRNSSATGELDSDSVKSLVAPPLPPAAALGLFLAFDENRDGHVDFKELCCGLSAACRGPTTERLKFCFKIFDQDGDGVLNSSELNTMVDVLCEVGNEHARNQSSRASTPDLPQGSDSSFNPHTLMDSLRDKLVSGRRVQGGDGGEIVEVEELVLAQGEFLIWAVERAEAALAPLLALVFEVCHVALGLRPHCAHHQRDIVSGWLRRANCRGFAVGQFWYLVSSEWWGAWVAWAGGACGCRAPPAADDDSLAATSCSDCSASLAWRADSASLASASSSGVSSAAARPPPPGPVDNSPLLAPGAPPAARSLTGEGGALRADRPLVQHADFQLLPAPLWAALAAWHGALHPLPRQVIRPPNSDVELELYPLQLMLYRHVPSPQKTGIGGVGGYVGVPAPPEKQLAYTAAFSRLATVRQVCEFVCQCLGLARDSVRLWALDAGELLSAEDAALHALGLASGARVLLERRAPDRTWPEDAGGRAATRRPHDLPGHTGLHNLGNTCYMNAALQAVWSSSAIREYFTRGLHLYELNTTNPLGTRGALALRYGELCKEVWSCRSRVVAPLRVRWCVSVWARALRAGGQHDAQELLAWLLDALHEDLNRARPAVEAGGEAKPEDDKGEAKAEEPKGDVAGAAAAWSAHLARDWSLVSELFCGLLKSRVRCDHCRKESVKFELFNMLSLPLPMDADVRLTVKVILLDGSVPVRYGVRVPADGTYLDLKVKLAELCHVPPERMIVVELSGHTVSRVWADSARLTTAHELTAYETPATRHHHTHGEPASRAARAAGEVSVGGGHTSSLCMPALFCFKRSRSELVMSHSPPATFLRHGDDYRSNTLPMEARRESSGGSPSPSVRSLPARAPRPARPHPPKYLIAVHRKQVRLESYFLCWQRVRPALFGAPLVVRARRGASGRELHARVWDHVARLLSARPQPATTNHAADCDDSLGYSFPFRLRVVGAGGEWCGVCPWAALCRGCLLPDTTAPLLLDSDEPDDASDCSDDCWLEGEIAEPVVDGITHHDDGHDVRDTDCGKCTGVVRRLDLRSLNGVMLAVDWDPTALHLRYQATREKAVVEHRSVGVVRREAGAGVELVQCLRAFTAPERLEQRYSCAACDAHQPATKSLQLWRLPPLLIIHLKRFQFVNNKWIKSQKVVNFPFEDFDPTEFLATVPQETILRHKEISQDLLRRPSTLGDAITESDSEGEGEGEGEKETHFEERRSRLNRRRKSIEDKRRARLESTSLLTTPVVDGRLQDYHEHRLQPHRDPFDLKYRLYAIVSHTGQMSGGHYVAYARAEGASEGEGAEGEEGGEGGAGESWVCYNDSACRRVAPAAIDRSAAYLLFYEREGLAADRYMPRVAGPPPPPPDSAHSDDDLRNVCALT